MIKSSRIITDEILKDCSEKIKMKYDQIFKGYGSALMLQTTSGAVTPASSMVDSMHIHSCSCVFKSDSRLNELSHIMQENGFSPVCESSCLLRLDALGKLLSHILHEYGKIL